MLLLAINSLIVINLRFGSLVLLNRPLAHLTVTGEPVSASPVRVHRPLDLLSGGKDLDVVEELSEVGASLS